MLWKKPENERRAFQTDFDFMSFGLDGIEALFPKELSEQRKGRLRDGLKQFHTAKTYTDFYSSGQPPYFLQGDLIAELRFPYWDGAERNYDKMYFNVVLISNSCDSDETNQSQRGISKQVLVAKLVTLSDFKEGLTKHNVENSESILNSLKNQEHSNLMYLPMINGQEYIAVLDEISWITNEELNNLKEDIKNNRLASLELFGYYLFIFKLSYHLCRLPEEIER